MARGGRRQGTPGKAYRNRLDLATNYQPSDPFNATEGTGGMKAPARPPVTPGYLLPDDITNLDAPSARPDEGVMSGIGESYSDGSPDNVDATLLAAYQRNPTAELRRVLDGLSARRFMGS